MHDDLLIIFKTAHFHGDRSLKLVGISELQREKSWLEGIQEACAVYITCPKCAMAQRYGRISEFAT